MKLRDRLEVRALVNLIISVLERIVNIILKFSPKSTVGTTQTPKVKPIKRIIDNIPIPWRNKK